MNYNKHIYSLLLATVLLTMGCVDEDPPAPIPEPTLECPLSFDVSLDGTSCDCLPPRVAIGDLKCRELNTDDFYSTMDGCLSDIGMIFYIGEARRVDSISGIAYLNIYVELPYQESEAPSYWLKGARRYSIENGLDSFAFEVSNGIYDVPSPNPNQADLETRFRGRFVDDYTIEGRFDFGPAGFPDYDTVVVSCPATFQRLPE